MNIAIYTLTSELHDAVAVERATREFLDGLGIDYVLKGSDYSDYGSSTLNLIYVRTGGTEGQFLKLLPVLQASKGDVSRTDIRPFYLLTSGKSNSLAASMEILAYLRQNGLRGEIIHGSREYVARRILLLAKAEKARQLMRGHRLGVIGRPSDWLISSNADYDYVKERLGVSLVDIPMEELLDIIAKIPETAQQDFKTGGHDVSSSLPGANRIYVALKTLVARHGLHGLTLRCFDLLTAVRNTGCLALARLNAEGVVASCEGDVPAMLSMEIAHVLTGVSGFQANPASIDIETGRMLFAHCTIPLNMVERYETDTHFESGIGVGIRGYVKTGPVTIFKVSGERPRADRHDMGVLPRYFIAEGELLGNEAEPDKCRTQLVIELADKRKANYFLTDPIGNHHIIVPGHVQELLEEILAKS